ncbi:MAG: methyltransferase domain-containing protein [Azoarcus sp.]|jgi:malonyl-CoA O-methyltransferase|nr:methyltransferase domain-containing protein [Azoarcus sp.]
METPFRLDHALLQRRLYHAAERGIDDGSDFLAREIARRMDERLDLIRIAPRRILDLGCGTGDDLARLGERYPNAERIGIDIAPPFLARALNRLAPRQNRLWRLFRKKSPPIQLASADALRLPLAEASVSLIWANLTLPFVDNPLRLFQEMHRVIQTDGLVMFTTFGPDTLRELREILPTHTGERVHRFTDMHDLGDTLIAAGFANPVLDMEIMTLTYSNPNKLFADLRSNAANNASLARPRGLTGRKAWETALARFEQTRLENALPITVELIQGHAWKPAPQQKPHETPTEHTPIWYASKNETHTKPVTPSNTKA